MKEMTSRKTGKIQVVSDEVYDRVLALGWGARYKVRDVPEGKKKDAPLITGAKDKKELNKKSESHD